MNKINFSHEYYKFPVAYKESLLVQTIVMDESALSEEFKLYDTCYKTQYMGDGYYPLPKGKIILLLLIANSGKGWLWSTIRRWTPEKEAYYRSIRGQQVEIVVE